MSNDPNDVASPNSTCSSQVGEGLNSSVMHHHGTEEDDTKHRKIFVGGLNYETDSSTLEAHFSQFGDIKEAVVITDRGTGRSKGYGFVTFYTAEAAKRACEEAKPVVDGRQCNCNLAYIGARPRGGRRNQFRQNGSLGMQMNPGVMHSPGSPFVVDVYGTPFFPSGPPITGGYTGGGNGVQMGAPIYGYSMNGYIPPPFPMYYPQPMMGPGPGGFPAQYVPQQQSVENPATEFTSENSEEGVERQAEQGFEEQCGSSDESIASQN